MATTIKDVCWKILMRLFRGDSMVAKSDKKMKKVGFNDDVSVRVMCNYPLESYQARLGPWEKRLFVIVLNLDVKKLLAHSIE